MISFIINDLYQGATRGLLYGVIGFYMPIISSTLYSQNKSEKAIAEIASLSTACGYLGFFGASMVKSRILATTYLLTIFTSIPAIVAYDRIKLKKND